MGSLLPPYQGDPADETDWLDLERAKQEGLLKGRASVLERNAEGTDVAEDLEDEDDDEVELEPWWCIRTEIWVCPNPDCDAYFSHVTGNHMIIVWPAKDDPAILTRAAICKDIGRNPRIEEYDEKFGSSMSYYQWEALGCPVHGSWLS